MFIVVAEFSTVALCLSRRGQRGVYPLPRFEADATVAA